MAFNKGIKHHSNKLTISQVLEIRGTYGRVKMKDTAEKFGVTIPTIHDIISGKTWKHL